MPPCGLLNQIISRRNNEMKAEERKYLNAREKEIKGKKQPSKKHHQPVAQVDKKTGAVAYRDEQ